jgi:hypothetical protein
MSRRYYFNSSYSEKGSLIPPLNLGFHTNHLHVASSLRSEHLLTCSVGSTTLIEPKLSWPDIEGGVHRSCTLAGDCS